MKNAKLKMPLAFVFTTIICFTMSHSFAQRLQGSTSFGLSAYKGDLNETNSPFSQMSPDFSLGLSYELWQGIRARLNFSVLGVKGDDKYNSRQDLRDRNLNFKSTVWEAGAMLEFDLLNETNYRLIPYVFGGPGVFHFDPTTIDRNGKKVYLHDVGTEGQYLSGPYANLRRPGYQLTQLNLQFGAGLRYVINENVSIAGEFSIRVLNTDYLDDVSQSKYIDPSTFMDLGQYEAAILVYRGDELPKPIPFSQQMLHPRGNPSNKDMYYSFQIRANFSLNFLHIKKPWDYYYNDNGYKHNRSLRNPKYVL
ncbi:DUF6089 family protein [Chitinophagaceae bacterium LWZ2-11]